MNTRAALSIFLPALVCLMVACGCGRASSDSRAPRGAAPDTLPDTLRVGTLYSPTSYFLYRDEPMGYDYELMNKFAAAKGLPMKIVTADNFHDMVAMLDSGKVDILAYEVPKTAEYKKVVLHCGPETETHQVLVQPLVEGKPQITDVTQLPGKKVYVEKDSKYFYRLQNLNREVGGGIEIVPIEKDSVMTEDMIEMVARGEIPLTVIDSDIARVSRTYYSDIDVSLPVGMAQTASWAVAPADKALAAAVDEWARTSSAQVENKELYRRYYELSKSLPREAEGTGALQNSMMGGGRISQYDEFFRRYAPEIGWDWRLLAAQGYQESRFDVEVVSWAGARGVMQLMPRTAQAMGLPMSQIKDPELNIKAAVKVIKSLNSTFENKVSDPRERLNFILAAYNSGAAHILDAIVIAKATGLNPQVWSGNVEKALLLKSKPEYYRLPGVKYGYFKGTQTVDYVKKVNAVWEHYKANIKA